MLRKTHCALALLILIQVAKGIVLDVTDRQSIVNASALVAHSVQALYNGNQTGGTLGKWPYPPYYWWESGGAWGGMMHYWAFTGDSSYNDVMMQALVSQLGPKYDFVLAAEMFDEGNDDQAFWVFNAMSAAEYGFPDPPSPAPNWSTVVVNAWNDYVQRWNTSSCNGGLQWQFYPSNAGYTYKQAISNGAFFQLSARLARFTGNQTYVNWADKIWDWVRGISLMDEFYNVYDGSDALINCTGIDHHQWTYNIGAFLYGTATLANYTSDVKWVNHTLGLLSATDVFFSPYTNATNIMFEHTCEEASVCNVDQYAMKAFLARWLGTTAVLAPYTAPFIQELLAASALGAAMSCTGGPYGNTCGSKWYINGYDGITGLGQELSALEVMVALLATNSTPPITEPQVTIAPYTEITPLPTVATSVASTATASSLHDGPVTSTAAARIFKREVPVIGGAVLAAAPWLWR